MLEKLKASGLHLLISAIIIGVFLLLVFFVWYPYPFYITEGLSHIILILLGVDLILGPVMTLILYKKGKKNLYIDLSIIIIIQLSAFIFGAITVSDGRPAYIVFATDAFKTVSPPMIDISTLKNRELKYSLFSGPIYIYATAPSNPEAHKKLLWSTLSGGKDIEQLPEYYQNYEQMLSYVQEKNNTYGYEKKLASSSKLVQELSANIGKNNLNSDKFGLYPFFGNKKNVIAIVNLDNGKIIGYLNSIP